jgi:hypothetical protein
MRSETKKENKMIDIEKDNTILMTPCKWSFEERILFNIKNNRCFEKSYSKWATFEINSFNDFSIIKKNDDGDYLINLLDCPFYEALDTHYEHWWGNKELKKEFDKGEYLDMDSFLEDKFNYNRIIISEKRTAVLPKEDYQKLKEIFKQ